jgi:ADP-ribose pyrophosphatase YjhB (NUDIX family)
MKGCTKVLFVNKNNEILLQLRTDKWTFFGGSIEGNETPEEAAVRKIKEDINYNLHFFTKVHEDIDSTGLRVWYLAYIEKSLDELQLNKGDAFGFFSYEQTQQLPLTENTSYVIDKIFGQMDTSAFEPNSIGSVGEAA